MNLLRILTARLPALLACGIVSAAGTAVAQPASSPPAALVGAWQKAKRPVELHLYESGGHGFGARGQGTSSDIWLDNFMHWLRTRGMLGAPLVAQAATGR